MGFKTAYYLFIVFFISLTVGRFYYNEVYDGTPKNHGTTLEGDQGFYDITALSVSKGEGYAFEGKPTSAYQIGYPLFLGAIYYIFGHNYRIAIIIQVILLSIAFILYTLLAIKINKFLFFFPLVLFVSNYTFIQFAYALMTETLALFLLILSMFLLYCFLQHKKTYYVFLLGLVYGFLILVRSVFQIYPLLLLLFAIYFIVKGNYRIYLKFFIFFLVSLIITFPILLRNYKKFGFFSLNASGGHMFYLGTNPKYDGIYQGWGQVEKDLNMQKYYGNQRQDLGLLAMTDRISVVDRILFQEGFNNIKKHPVRTVVIICKNISRLLFYAPYKDKKLSLQRLILSFINMLSVVSMLIGFWLVISGRIMLEPNLKKFLFFCYSAIFYYIAVSSFFAVTPRFGIYPLVLIYLLSPIALLTIKSKSVKVT
ncbi:MAG: hypothetical protein Q8O30_06020 [Candidatus Omnitrophota bacterium]|nr:hypothetical protein [Candidatus Omnitrophota bacterium]